MQGEMSRIARICLLFSVDRPIFGALAAFEKSGEQPGLGAARGNKPHSENLSDGMRRPVSDGMRYAPND